MEDTNVIMPEHEGVEETLQQPKKAKKDMKKNVTSWIAGFQSILVKMKAMKREDVKKLLLLCVLVVVIVAAVAVGISLLTNNYMTPIRYSEKYANKDEYSSEKASLDYFNGLGKKEWKQIYEIMHNSDDYLDMQEEIDDTIVKAYERKQNKYGDDYRVKYEVVDKLELEKSELREYRSQIQDLVDFYGELSDEAEDFTSEEWADFADQIDLRKSEAKELIECFRALAEEFGRVSVDKGYELELTQIITGSELEEPKEDKLSVVVLKVNGRWISYMNLMKAMKEIF